MKTMGIVSSNMPKTTIAAAEAAARMEGVSRSAWVAQVVEAAALEALADGDPEAAAEAARAEVERLEAARDRIGRRIAAARSRLDAVAGDGDDEDTTN